MVRRPGRMGADYSRQALIPTDPAELSRDRRAARLRDRACGAVRSVVVVALLDHDGLGDRVAAEAVEGDNEEVIRLSL